MQNTKLTHGSLFSGIGGFEVAAGECGIDTLWNCEIEPYCRLVLKARFPQSVQYGDICKLDGGKIAPVDIISFGSPCQSFSVAGKRKGLDGASGLFYEAVRVIQQMREATGGKYPRYVVMENVTGIYSSKTNDKSDFLEVLNELIQITQPKDKTITIPEPEKKKWLHAGAVVGDGYSLAWRTLSSDGFGVAQRRRRMFLVVSFADEGAGEILFEREGVCRDFTPSYLKRKAPTPNTGENPQSTGTTGSVGFEPGALKRMGRCVWAEATGTLRAHMGDNQTAVAIGNHPADSRLTICEDGVFPTLTGRSGTGGNNVHCVLQTRIYGMSAHNSNAMKSANPHAGIFETDMGKTVDTSGTPASAQGGILIAEHHAEDSYAVRKLTPLECLRLQGFEDSHLSEIHIANPTEQDVDDWYGVWEENRIALGKATRPRSHNMVRKWLRHPYSNGASYKAIGNALAVPCAIFVMRGIAESACAKP